MRHISNLVRDSVQDLLFAFLHSHPKGELDLICSAMWLIWHRLNQILFSAPNSRATPNWNQIFEWLTEYHDQGKVFQGRAAPSATSPPKWQPTSTNLPKLNVDASVLSGCTYVTVGGVLRDHQGIVYGAFDQKIQGNLSPVAAEAEAEAEAVAVREGLLFSQRSGWKIDIIESDASTVIEAINKCQLTSPIGPLISEIHHLKTTSPGIIFTFTPRLGNSVAHSLAKQAMERNVCGLWTNAIPLFIAPYVILDVG
ncbi:hypothetical protein Scep_024279 [Stephania cephalantha]|uniref:RNase H type-1 domain-containing protein n=1 Tax=Stephania cephalantha TaxID=152367 RepID=A0AAP0EWW5_9MAGN